MSYIYDAYTHIGGRTNNEDEYLVIEKEDCYLFVVADGLGGYDYGEIASKTLVKEMNDIFCNDPKRFDVENAILSANAKILMRQKETGLKMKTTVTAIYINQEHTICANVGDSRTYLFRNRDIVFQSIDHSASQMAVHLGKIRKEAIRNHEDRNVLTRAVGALEELKVDIVKINPNKYDSILLCTDGFWEYILENEMCEALDISETPDSWLFKMRKLLEHRIPVRNDNNTAIAVMKRGI